MAHSIPEAQALVIARPPARAAYRRLEARPARRWSARRPTRRRWQALATKGVLAMVCDSTNAMVEGHSGSEADVAAAWQR
jgi:ribonuclease J